LLWLFAGLHILFGSSCSWYRWFVLEYSKYCISLFFVRYFSAYYFMLLWVEELVNLFLIFHYLIIFCNF
jgi:hypothetical protein